MYSVQNIQVNESHPLFKWCDTITHLTNNLENAMIYRVRQIITGVQKEKLTCNEQEVFDEVKRACERKKKRFPDKKHFLLPYEIWDCALKLNKNSDYIAKGLPKQTAQQAIKQVLRNFKAYYAAKKKWYTDKGDMTGEPNMPAYHVKGGKCTAILTNQDCVLYKDGVKMPLTSIRCKIGKTDGRLKEAKIKPYCGIFIISFVFEQPDTAKSNLNPKRIYVIDLGVNNFAAITNNAGLPCIIFKGRAIKAVNQWFNKKLAEELSRQTIGTADKAKTSPVIQKISLRRENQISDYMHKAARQIIDSCIRNNIGSIVIGLSSDWKQGCEIGKVGNQNFVQIPFTKFIGYVQYLSERYGIRLVVREESYTSKASFLDGDYIPTYDKSNPEHNNYVFSGKRIKRGLYRTKSGRIINADLNGSANIGRKEFPQMFMTGIMPDFNNVRIFKYPDITLTDINRWQQKILITGKPKAAKKRQIHKAKQKVAQQVIQIG